jgi:predicted SAM-dependent methyltransferase
LANETVDFVYSSHFLEHLTRREASKIVKDCFRVLKPGGWIRLVCPDLRILARKYLEGDIGYPLFNVWPKAQLSEAFIESLCLVDNRSILAKFLSPGFSHLYMYDFDSIAELLSECGFPVTNVCCFREGATPDIDKLDNRPDESLFVEAQKPGL